MTHKQTRVTADRKSLVLILDVMLHFQLGQFFFSSCKISLCGGSILFRWHVIKNNDITFLQMETIEMV